MNTYPKRYRLWTLSVLLLCGGTPFAGCKQDPPPPQRPHSTERSPLLREPSPTSRPATTAQTPALSKIPSDPAIRAKLIAQHIRLILGGKHGENSQLLTSINTLRASEALQQETVPLMVKQLPWESGRRACHLLVALYKLTTSSGHDLTAIVLPSAGKKASHHIRNIDCPDGISLKKIRINQLLLPGAKLPQADLSQASLSQGGLSRADLRKANLISAEMTGIQLTEAHLDQSNLTLATMTQANLRSARLHKASMVGTHLEKADLRKANLQQADLSAAKLQGANFRNANLRNARLIKANLQGVQLQGAQLQGALFSASARPILRKTRVSLHKAICVLEPQIRTCQLWPITDTPAPSVPQPSSATCPKLPLHGPIFVYSQTEYDALPNAKRKKLTKFGCP